MASGRAVRLGYLAMREVIELQQRIAQLERAKGGHPANTKDELASSRTLLLLTIDAIQDPVLIIDRDYRVVLANRAARVKSGHADGQLLDRECYRISHHREMPCEAAGENCPLSKAVHTRKPVTVTHMHYESSGVQTESEVSATPVLDDRGEVLYIIESCRDISERRRAQDLIHESTARYRALFDKAPVGIILMNSAGKIVDANEIFATMHGLSVDEVLGLRPGQLAAKDFSALLPDRIERLKEGQVFRTDAQHSLKDGSVITVSITACRIDLEGKPCVLAFYHDMTERLKAEAESRVMREELTHLARMTTMGKLSASLAHELNQPLTAILNNAQAAKLLLSRSQIDKQALAEILTDIINDDKRAGDVIRKVRGLLKKTQPSNDLLDLNALVRETASLMKNNMTFNRTNVLMELAPGPLWICGDRIQLQQVMLNLILNALDAMSAVIERALTIRSIRGTEETVTVSVSDTGEGVDHKSRQELFKPFFTTKQEGLGIGLPICRTIIEAHGGRLWHESNSSRGATFCFSLKTAPVGHE